MKNIAILGSTGSIGRSTLAVAERFADRLRIVALAGGRNTALLGEQVKRYRPRLVAVANDEPPVELVDACRESGSELLAGAQALTSAATLREADIVVSATVGAVGLEPTLRAVEAGKRVALANKEVLVMAGALVTAAAGKSGAEILPVDSEHNAIFQCLEGNARGSLRRILLCASGGPLLQRDREDLERVTIDEALDHPRWNMGRKVSIDSATMMNKGLEMIEARWLFALEPGQISVLIHPQAIVHSLVEYVDGSVIAQLSLADMEIPIQYCLSYPERWSDRTKALDLAAVSPLEFFAPDLEKFPALELTRAALEEGGTAPVVLNAADEVAVEAFLAGRITFSAIVEIVSRVMERERPASRIELEGILEVDCWARGAAGEEIGKLTG